MVNARFHPLASALRRWAPAALLAAALGLAAPAAAQAPEAGLFLRIGTGGEAGSEFAVGQVLAAALQQTFSAQDCGLPDCTAAPSLVAAQLSAGGIANLRDLRDGRLEAALAAAPAVRWAVRGEGPFAAEGPANGLRAVAALYPAALQVVTLARSGLSRIGDLRGRRVALGGPGSATRPLARRVLAAYRLGEDSFEALDLDPEIALERLAAGRLDAFFALGAVPLDAVERVAAIAEIRLLAVSPARLAGDPAVAETTVAASIPTGAYEGLPEVETLATPVQLLVREDLGADLVYAVTARLWAADTRRQLAAALAPAGALSLEEALDGLEAPIHPGAERFYRERGLLP